MNETTLTALEMLADRLGTSVEYLMAVMTRQVVITGYRDLVIGIVFLVVALLAGAFFVKIAVNVPKKPTEKRNMNEEDYNQYRAAVRVRQAYKDDWDDTAKTLLIAFAACGFVSTMLLVDVPSKLLNPEYWAVKEIIKLLSELT